MKYNTSVTSDRGKQRKAHFASDSTTRRKLMSSHLSKDLRKKFNVRRWLRRERGAGAMLLVLLRVAHVFSPATLLHRTGALDPCAQG